MRQLLETQYQWVQEARNIMLGLCEQLTPAELTRSSPHVGNGGSVRNLLVHICNSYFGWLNNFAAGQSLPLQQYEGFTSLDQCKGYFQECDGIMRSFLIRYEENYTTSINEKMHGRQVITTPLQLFTHVVTHEFHHKGQILSLCRLWGHTPLDTDILR